MAKTTIEQVNQQIETIKSSEYPVLTGSPKQVAWAEKIRTPYLEWVKARIADYERAGGDVLHSGLPGLLDNATHHLSHEKASYWIEERNDLK